MRAPLSSLRLVLAGVVLVSGVPGAARAQVPPAAPAPPGYAAPGGWAPPPGYAPYAMPPQQGYYGQGYAPAPYVPMRRRSSGMMAAGITMLALGGTGLIIGMSLFSAGNTTTYSYPPCADGFNCGPILSNDSGLKSAGIGAIVVSVVSLGVGLPLTLVGMQKVRDTSAPAALVPDLRVGAGGGAMAWRF